MFGGTYFGKPYFGRSYWGPGIGVTPPTPTPTGGGSSDHYSKLVGEERRRQEAARHKHREPQHQPAHVHEPVPDFAAMHAAARLTSLSDDLASREAELADALAMLQEQRRIEQEDQNTAIALLLMAA